MRTSEIKRISSSRIFTTVITNATVIYVYNYTAIVWVLQWKLRATNIPSRCCFSVLEFSVYSKGKTVGLQPYFIKLNVSLKCWNIYGRRCELAIVFWRIRFYFYDCPSRSSTVGVHTFRVDSELYNQRRITDRRGAVLCVCVCLYNCLSNRSNSVHDYSSLYMAWNCQSGERQRQRKVW